MFNGEIVLVMGPPACGKTTYSKSLVEQGYCRLNRDSLGGSLGMAGAPIYQSLREKYGEGHRKFVLDNTFGTKESRMAAVAIAKELGLPIRVIWLNADLGQVQFLASLRQVRHYGRLLTPDDYKDPAVKGNPSMFPPAAQFAYFKRFEPPTTDEGFDSVERVDVEIKLGPEYTAKAVIFDLDGTLRGTRSGEIYPRHPADVKILPGRKSRLADLKAQGYLLLGATNQSGTSRPANDYRYVSESTVIECIEETLEQLGQPDMDVAYAPERAGVPQSFWRKPCPGMGVVFLERYRLDPSKVIVVGDMQTDQTFAERCGFQYEDADKFFG